MPVEHCKISIEAKPLRSLYSKYCGEEGNGTSQVVRPLGSLRKGENQWLNESSATHRNVAGVINIERISSDADITMKNHYLEGDIGKKRESVYSGLESREKTPGFPSVSRIKRLDFENKFRIAASRGNGQDLANMKSNKDSSKKVIHLPLFQINLRTYGEENEITRTVASTRESLRQLMEIHQSRMKPANVVAANIKNYEFCAPPSGSATSRSECSSGYNSQPFPAKPAIKIPRQRDSEGKNGVVAKKVLKFGITNNTNIREDSEIKVNALDANGSVRNSARSKFDRLLSQEEEEEFNDSILSVAIRPDTALTLGSTIHHLDRVVKTPGSDELKEITEALKGTDPQPSWPSYNDVQMLRTPRNHHLDRGSRSKHSAFGDEHIINETHESDQSTYRNRYSGHYRAVSGPQYAKPVFRYTSKTAGYKLDPIIVPSHTCTECPMCNIYQREVETPCPPNSPMSSQFMEAQCMMDRTIPQDKTSARASRNRNHEILHISRINVAGSVSPTDDPHVLSYMKANG